MSANERWDDPIDHAELQREWRALTARLDRLIDESWGLLRAEEIYAHDFAIRAVRTRIAELARLTTYAEQEINP